ncbi:hypothetical protein [Salimicrobium flavidum]|uniref:hypothetical protein n=1 Tax=Salimicrobium flavidum TaxID=570947 RepID=UPI0013563D7D|nr:hypothetical protein [Salimicrobium flavidum]
MEIAIKTNRDGQSKPPLKSEDTAKPNKNPKTNNDKSFTLPLLLTPQNLSFEKRFSKKT